MITGHSSGSKRTMFRGGGGENHRPPRAMSLPRIPCTQELGEIPYDPQSKRINVHIRPDHFRMETLRSILPLLRPGDWTASIDLKDAYHHVPIAPASRDLLGFTVPLQGSAFRPQARTAPVHKTGRVRGGLPQTAGPKIVRLSGRLASGGRVPRRTVPAVALSSPDCAGRGLSGKLEKIGVRAHAASDLPTWLPPRASAAGGRPQPGYGSNFWGTWPA